MSHNERLLDQGLGNPVFGAVAEFATPHALIEGMKAVRAAGFTQVDSHTPFPVHGMDKAMGMPQSKLPYLVLAGGLTGTCCAVLMQAWMNGIDYPVLIGGKPLFSYQSWVPVSFELTVLLAAFTAVLGMLALNGLPRPYHPLFTHPRFAKATDDAFFISIEAVDPKWDEELVKKVLADAGGTEIAIIHDDAEFAHG